MSTSHRSGQQVSQYILLVGVLVIVVVMIWTASTYLGQIQLPEQYRHNLTAVSDRQTRDSIVRLTDRCWTKADRGGSEEYIDCYSVAYDLDQPLTRDSVAQALDITPPERLNMSQPLSGTGTARIRYLGGSRNITIG